MVVPYQGIRDSVFGRVPIIRGTEQYPIDLKQIQPASIDLRLGRKVYRNWAAAIPHNRFVADVLKSQRKYDFELDSTQVHELEKDHTYIIDLIESCTLPDDTFLEFSPKSSTGRCDVFTRVICDRNGYYDRTPAGYHGPLYLEVTPKSFDVGVTECLELMQARIKHVGAQTLEDSEIKRLHMAECLLCDTNGKPLDQQQLEIHDRELFFHIDLDRDIVGFAVKSTVMQSLNLKLRDVEPDDFWQPIRRPKNGELVLVPEHFYLLCTKERVRIPAGVCGQIPAYSTTIGEMRTHYAGFFDPNFGGDLGTSGVLEVRVRDMPFAFVDGQVICSMKFERMDGLPEKLYGENGSNYNGSGPSLSKHFCQREEAWEKDYWRSVWK